MTNVLISLIEKTAPLLASAIGGPFASVAVSLVSSLFGANPSDTQDILSKIQTDPEAAIKLKQLELQHQEALEQIKATAYATEHADLMDARDFDSKNNNGSIIAFLITTLILGIASCFTALWYLQTDKSSVAIISAALTTLLHQVPKVYNLYFGDSKDSL